MIRIISILPFLILSFSAYSQVSADLDFKYATSFQTDSGVFIIYNIHEGCKAFSQRNLFIPKSGFPKISSKTLSHKEVIKDNPIIIHGNVIYNFNYRSYIDTPFAENDIMQHYIQTRLNVKITDKYPFTVYLTSRRSNSPYFRNATDVSFQFRQFEMLEDIKRKMRAEEETILAQKVLLLTPSQIYQQQKNGVLKEAGSFSISSINNTADKLGDSRRKMIEEKYNKLYEDYKAKMDKLNALQKWTKSLSRNQEIVEEKEKKLRGDANQLKDSLENIVLNKEKRFFEKHLGKSENKLKGAKELGEEKKLEMDSVKKEVLQSEKELKIFQKKIIDSVQQIRKQILAIKDPSNLNEYLQKSGQSNNRITRLQRTLLSVKQIGIGRTWIDYSELTVKNISLNGINVEANPGNIYLAAAAGKVNYRFRDYIVKGSNAGSNQSVGLVRAGYGKKDRNNFIITFYSGKKALLNQRTNADSAAVQNISGISIETRVALNANNYLISEYARSVSPALKGKLTDLKDHRNEAWSLKLFTHYANTKLTSYYRKTGENFQSFTLFPTNNRQDAWMVRANQTLWKKQLILDAAIRKNDFNSPIALPDLSNQNVFKSFQITERIKKLPFASVGYYPSSQLTLSNNNVLYENRYNTLNAIVSHTYFIRKISMNSTATFTKFYNQGIDTGFIYYDASTFTFNHSINLSHFILQGTLSLTDQSLLHQLTIEPGIIYSIKNKLSVSGSVKRSRLNHTETFWGGTAGLNLYLNKIGMLQLQYDKIYLPGYNRNLMPVDIGRMTFSREF